MIDACRFLERLWRQVSRCRAALLMLAIAITPAETASQPVKKPVDPLLAPMVFAIFRSADQTCEPNCPEWIYGEGQIVPQSVAAFKKILKQAGDRKLPLLIVSPGGSVMDAIKIGKMARIRGMNVEVAATRWAGCNWRLPDCKPDADGRFYRGRAFSGNAFCWSACPLILAGGIKRYASNWSLVGVHQITTIYRKERVFYRQKYRIVNGKRKVVGRKIISRKNVGSSTTTKLPKATRKALLVYFKEMGVDPSLLETMLLTPADKIRTLAPVEMLNMRLITTLSSTATLANPALCTQSVAVQNCVSIKQQALASDAGLPPAQP